MNPTPFYKNGLTFTCQQCSYCCRGEPGFVYLSENDLTKLLDWFKLEKNAFISQYCRWSPYYDGSEVLCLKEKRNNDCIFWENGCSVYQARPLQCRTYPFWDFIIADEDSWNAAASDCPGINCGAVHACCEIEEKAWETRRNQPVRKNE